MSYQIIIKDEQDEVKVQNVEEGCNRNIIDTLQKRGDCVGAIVMNEARARVLCKKLQQQFEYIEDEEREKEFTVEIEYTGTDTITVRARNEEDAQTAAEYDFDMAEIDFSDAEVTANQAECLDDEGEVDDPSSNKENIFTTEHAHPVMAKSDSDGEAKNKKLIEAASVIVLTPTIKAFLEHVDPKALEQLSEALLEVEEGKAEENILPAT